MFAGHIRRQRISRMHRFRYWRWHLNKMYGGSMRYAIIKFTALISFITYPVAAQDQILSIPDASQIAFVANPDGKVYLRNLQQFNPSWAGCCYNHWIDTTTDAGRTQFAIFLTAYYSQKPIMFYANPAGGVFLHVGRF